MRTDLKKYAYCLQAALLSISAVTLLLLFLLPANAYTPHSNSLPIDEGSWTTYTTTHGLPSDYVYGGTVLDENGHVWAGFQNGGLDPVDPLPINPLISRWNGNLWQTYELPGCRVSALAANRFIYAGTYCPGPPSGAGRGLSAFIEDSWVNFMPADGMFGTYVNAIATEKDNKVWVTASDVLCCYGRLNLLDHKGTATKADDEWILYQFPDYPRVIDTIAIDPKGNRWFGTLDGVLKLTADDTWEIYGTDVISSASDIVFDASGGAWFRSSFGRVAHYYEGTWTYYDTREAAIEANYDVILTSINSNTVRDVWSPGLWAIEGNAGVWIINNDRNGVSFYDGESWLHYTSQNSGLGGNKVSGITVDGYGDVWFATRGVYGSYETGGVSRFTPLPDFALEIQPAHFLVAPGEAAPLNLDVALSRGFVPTVSLSIAGLPLSTSATFSLNPVKPTADVQLTISSTIEADLGHYPLLVSAVGMDITHSVPATMYVVPEVHRYYFPVAFK